MSLDLSGGTAPVVPGSVCIFVATEHPLIKLANALPWSALMEIVVADLKTTTAKGRWWLGRKLLVRVHLAAYLLQKIYDFTDRQTEYFLQDNAAFQLFSGKGIVPGWHAPDHTKIEEFRSRLSPEVQRSIANAMSQLAVNFGFADGSDVDFDSTVQEANMAYPSDATLMKKIAEKVHHVIEYVKSKTTIAINDIDVGIQKIRKHAKAYFFLGRTDAIEKRRAVFEQYHTVVVDELVPILKRLRDVTHEQALQLPWHIRATFTQVVKHGDKYLADVAHFVQTHTMRAGKLLSFHAQQVVCIMKGKLGKDKEFGRVFQLGRIRGNFLFVMPSTSIQMNDKKSLPAMLAEHARVFGEGTLKSVAADKGYWSSRNVRALEQLGVVEIGLQYPANIKSTKQLPSGCQAAAKQLPSGDLQERLRDRRAGIEPLIGHAKQGGQLGKSRMKTDTATLAAGYASVLGFNLRQFVKKQRLEAARAA